MKKRSKRNKRKRRIRRIIFLLLILIIGGLGYYAYTNGYFEGKLDNIVKPKSRLKIVDENSKSRPFAVMIDTSDSGRANHTGLQDAYITYEIITEGGITRMMALFKDQNTSVIGPVRSSRHYYLDYAMENDAIYAHYGYSDRAKNDITSLDISNLNGITNASNSYWRDSNLQAPHNVFTSIAKLKDAAKELDYEMNTDTSLLLNYSAKRISLEDEENSVEALNIEIPFSYAHTTSYEYSDVKKYYYRSINGEAHVDNKTNEQYHVKNIIILSVENYSFDDYGRQDLENLGSGDGYFITNGFAIPITWEKQSRSSKTVYKKLDGTEIKVNDGNTAIEIQPITQEVSIS